MAPDELRRAIFDMTGDKNAAGEAAARRQLERERASNLEAMQEK